LWEFDSPRPRSSLAPNGAEVTGPQAGG
jgi:hypothetical protein